MKVIVSDHVQNYKEVFELRNQLTQLILRRLVGGTRRDLSPPRFFLLLRVF